MNEKKDATTTTSIHQTPIAPDILHSTARLQVLAQISHAFAMVATDYQLLLDEIARTSADLVGDGCVVTLIGPDGETLINAANAHRDPALEAAYKAYLSGMAINKTTSATISAAVIRTGEPKLVPRIDPDVLVAQTDDALKPLVARLNVHSFAVVAIRARRTVIGSLSLMRSGPDRGYGEEDLTLLQDLADRAGLAIENARLYDDLERRVRERTAELEAVNEELEAFSYSVAHDLRAPLRSIDGFSKALIEECSGRLDEHGLIYVARVRGAAERMGHLIDDLLNLSQITRVQLQREAVDVSEAARAAVARLREAHPERAVDVVIQPGMVAQADTRLVEVVLTNLIGNAWKFTGKRTGARIEVAARTEQHPTVYLISDNGTGFDPANAQKLFGVFQRLHSADEFEGTGIGLATVQRIVRRHGGQVWAEANVNRGATFYFTLEPTGYELRPPA